MILSLFQSGFQGGKSTVTQLLEICNKFCQAVDENKEIWVVFLDISKTFNKVWHCGLIFKLNQCGIGGNLLKWFEDYLRKHLQSIIINALASEWGDIRAGIILGSVLGPLLFLLVINNIIYVVSHCNIWLFTDDSCLFIEVNKCEETAKLISQDLNSIQHWANR